MVVNTIVGSSRGLSGTHADFQEGKDRLLSKNCPLECADSVPSTRDATPTAAALNHPVTSYLTQQSRHNLVNGGSLRTRGTLLTLEIPSTAPKLPRPVQPQDRLINLPLAWKTSLWRETELFVYLSQLLDGEDIGSLNDRHL